MLGIDVETTGLDPDKHSICEVGAALYDTEAQRLVKQTCYLIDLPIGITWDEEAMTVTHLSPELCTKYGHDEDKSLRQLLSLMNSADVIFAHNGNLCDKVFIQAWCKKFEYEMPDKLWVDTMTDIKWPREYSKRLGYLAAEHGFLNPFPHNALADVLTTLLLIQRYPLEDILERAKSPTVHLKAVVSFDGKEAAKERGYYALYENNKFKMWTKTVKECDLEEEMSAPFPVEKLPPVK